MKPSLSQVPLIGADVVPDEPSPDVVDVVVVEVVLVELCCVVVPIQHNVQHSLAIQLLLWTQFSDDKKFRLT